MEPGDLVEISFPRTLEELPGMKERQGKRGVLVAVYPIVGKEGNGWWKVLLDGRVVEVFNGHLKRVEGQ
jgi:hypothetical protein